MAKTKKIYTNLMISLLEMEGYDCSIDDKYIKASNSYCNLLILTKCKALNFNGNESNPIRICNEDDVKKLINKAKSYDEKFIPAIGIGVGINNYFNSQISIIPISVWYEKAESGSAFFVTNKENEIALHYNLYKLTNKNDEDFILKFKVNIKNDI